MQGMSERRYAAHGREWCRRVRSQHRRHPLERHQRHRRLVHRHRLQRGELLRPPRLFLRRQRSLQEPEDGTVGPDRRGRLGDALFRHLAPVRAAGERSHCGEGHQPLRRRGGEGVRGLSMRGLVIREPWIGLILRGQKTWEMRSKPTNVRGRIALISAKSGLIVGTAKLVASESALTSHNYMQHRDRHAIPENKLDEVIENGWVHPWVLEDVHALAEPVPYQHPSGAVTFVNLEPSVVAQIESNGSPISPSPVDNSVSPDLIEEDGAPPSLTSSPRARAKRADSLDSNEEAPWFVFRPETAQAYGRPLPGGEFLVGKGSTAMRHGSPNVKRDEHDRDALVRNGVLTPDPDGRHYRFSRDHVFSSSSKAAGIIKDGNASGPSLWKEVSTGRSLRDYLAGCRPPL